MYCPDCRNHVRSYDEYCQRCGADLHQSRLEQGKRKMKVLFWTF